MERGGAAVGRQAELGEGYLLPFHPFHTIRNKRREYFYNYLHSISFRQKRFT